MVVPEFQNKIITCFIAGFGQCFQYEEIGQLFEVEAGSEEKLINSHVNIIYEE